MQPQPHYSRAPLVEALIDIRATLPSSTTLDALATLQTGEATRYPQRLNQRTAEGRFLVGDEGTSASATSQVTGFRFVSGDGLQLFQARLDGFTFNRLAPYENWETFRTEARRLWERYEQAAQPESITRLAVRYINRIDLPSSLSDFKEYLRTVPEIAPPIDRGLSSFLMRLVLPQEDISSVLILSETVVPPHDAEHVSILLDIDLFRERPVPPQDADEVWSFFEQLRVRKNEIFNACITDALREMIV